MKRSSPPEGRLIFPIVFMLFSWSMAYYTLVNRPEYVEGYPALIVLNLIVFGLCWLASIISFL